MRAIPVAIAVVIAALVGSEAGAQTARRRVVSPAAPLRPLSSCASGVVVKADEALDLAVDDTHVYYGTGSELRRVPKNGGSAPTTAAQAGSNFIALMTADDTHVFFASFDPFSFIGTVTAVPKNGAAPRVILTNILTPFQIVHDSRYVYVSSLGTPSGDAYLNDGRIVRVTKDGAEVKTLASGITVPLALAVRGEDLFYSEFDAEGETASLRRVSINGGESAIVAADTIVFAIAADSADLYYSGLDLNTFTPKIWRRRGATTTVLLEDAYTQFLRLAGTELYFLSLNEDDTLAIRAMPLSGGPPRTVAAVEPTYRFMVDECLVYYTTVEGVERSSR